MITIPVMIAGIGMNQIIDGKMGLIDSIAGILIAFGLLMIPFMIGGLGGGDVKLMMAIGAIMGFHFTLQTIVYTAIIGACIALGIIIPQKRCAKAFVNLKQYILSMILLQSLVKIDQVENQTYFPYGLPIAMGAFMALYMNLKG